MKTFCPHCRRPFSPEDINEVTDLALCPACGQVTQLSEPGDAEFSSKALPRPPEGAWYRESAEGSVFGATTRDSMAILMGLFGFAPFIFAMFFYYPQIAFGRFSLALSLIGIFPATMCAGIWSYALMCVCGKVEVSIREGSGTAFVGIGQLGWQRSFNLDEIDAIENGLPHKSRRGPGVEECIVLRGKSVMSFGRMLTGSRQHFMVKVFRQLKARRGGKG